MLKALKCLEVRTAATAVSATVIDVTSWQYEVNTHTGTSQHSVTLLQSEADFILQPASVCVCACVCVGQRCVLIAPRYGRKQPDGDGGSVCVFVCFVCFSRRRMGE